MARSTGTARSRLLGPALRAAYEKRGTTLRELESQTGIPNSTLSRMFKGERNVSLDQATQILDALGVEGAERASILDRAAGGDNADHGWWPIGVPDPAMHLAAMLEFDRTMTEFIEVHMVMFPSVTQAEKYARGIIARKAPAHEVGQRVAVRLGRREMLRRRDPVKVTVIVGEAALANEIGGHDGMTEQLAYALELTKKVDFRILPADVGPHDCLANPAFSVLRFAEASPLVHLEIGDSGTYIDDEAIVDWYENAVREVLTLALSPEMSVMKLTEMLTDRMETT
jgi:hypothetical protein